MRNCKDLHLPRYICFAENRVNCKAAMDIFNLLHFVNTEEGYAREQDGFGAILLPCFEPVSFFFKFAFLTSCNLKVK